MKSCTKKQSTPGCIIYDGTRALTPEDKANVFNQFFCSVSFNKRIDTLSSLRGHGCDYSTSLPVHLINDVICTPSEVARVLKSLNVNKACGPDGISPWSLFNYSLSRGSIPIDWKTANVVSSFKSG